MKEECEFGKNGDMGDDTRVRGSQATFIQAIAWEGLKSISNRLEQSHFAF